MFIKVEALKTGRSPFYPKKRNRVSVVNIRVNGESEKETRFLSPGEAIKKLGFFCGYHS